MINAPNREHTSRTNKTRETDLTAFGIARAIYTFAQVVYPIPCTDGLELLSSVIGHLEGNVDKGDCR